MKAAFACWENRIAPVFDTARRIHVVEVASGRIVREGKEALPGDQPVRKALHLAESGIDTLVCGAISRPLHGLVSSHGIRVIPFVAGDLGEIVRAWLDGNLRGDAFAMPGCRGRGGLRRFRGPGGFPFDAGSAETCVCLECGHREPHESGLPCRARTCPRCGGRMGRES